MKDPEMTRFLAGLKVPDADAAGKARARYRALVAFSHSPENAQRELHFRNLAGWWWALACGVVVFASALWISVLPEEAVSRSAEQRTLEQVEKLFPGQVNAVIQQGGTLDLELTDSVVGGSSQPVVVEFFQGNEVVRVLSYSGRRVCVNLGGSTSCFEPLVTAEGSVILSGETILWTPEHPSLPSGYRVEAYLLHPAS